MPGQEVARRPRGLVVRNRLWVQGWVFPLSSQLCGFWWGHSNLSAALPGRLAPLAGRWQGLVMSLAGAAHSWCCVL